MRRHRTLHPTQLCFALTLAAVSAAWAQGTVGSAALPGGDTPTPIIRYGDDPPPAGFMKLTLPGQGAARDEDGLIDPGAAISLGIPLAYTLYEHQLTGGLWGVEIDSDWMNLATVSFGFGPPSRGITATIAGADTGGSDAITGHIQGQIWPETRKWPAIAAGVFDVADNYERSYYVTATKRIGEPHPKHMRVAAVKTAWPGGDRSPAAEYPATWGTMRLLAEGESLPEDAPDTLIGVPFSKFPPILDGMLGSEWEDATQVKLDLPGGEFMLVGAKYTLNTLYVVVGIPSDRYLRLGSRAQLCIEAPKGENGSLGEHHTIWTLAYGPEKARVYRQVQRMVDGRWRTRELAEEPSRVAHGSSSQVGGTVGTVANGGDGAWHYPVFEFAVPLSAAGLEPGKADVGMCVIADLPGGSEAAQIKRDPEYRVRWPLGRGAYGKGAAGKVFATRPDLWGQVLFAATEPRGDQIVANRVEQELVIDGAMGEQEWAGAEGVDQDVAVGVAQSVRVQRSDEFLYVGSKWDVSAGKWAEQVVDVLVDPEGDEGLVPRQDDRLLRVTVGDEVKLETLMWDQKRRDWVSGETSRRGKYLEWIEARSLPFQAAAGSETTPTGTISTVEVRIPLASLGVDGGADSDDVMGLGVETVVTALPASLQTRGATTEASPGESAYVTAGWGTGAFRKRVFYGISQPLGNVRGVAEYDGDAVNLGVTGAISGHDNTRFTLGWREPSEGEGTPIIGGFLSTKF